MTDTTKRTVDEHTADGVKWLKRAASAHLIGEQLFWAGVVVWVVTLFTRTGYSGAAAATVMWIGLVIEHGISKLYLRRGGQFFEYAETQRRIDEQQEKLNRLTGRK